jgi:hypothetical protein
MIYDPDGNNVASVSLDKPIGVYHSAALHAVFVGAGDSVSAISTSSFEVPSAQCAGLVT